MVSPGQVQRFDVNLDATGFCLLFTPSSLLAPLCLWLYTTATSLQAHESFSMALPTLVVPRVPDAWPQHEDPQAWDAIPAVPPLWLADGSGPARQQTRVRLCYDTQRLYARFDCDDDDIWWTYTRRDDPLYEEEVVELFIAPGEATPTRYYEFEVSPAGALLDAAIYNPTSSRADLQVDLSWSPATLRWSAWHDRVARAWGALLIVPWELIVPEGPLPQLWRANLYRIERPRNATPEFSCWSPTLTEPADFHKPARFGFLQLA